MVDGSKLSTSPDHNRADPVVVQTAARKDAASFQYASLDLQYNQSFVCKIVDMRVLSSKITWHHRVGL